MGKKLELNEEFIIKEYLGGKSSLVLEKEMGVSKPSILKILKKYNVTRRRDRCKSLDIKKNGDKYVILRKCPKCDNNIKTTSKDRTIACRNYFNAINENRKCVKCMGESFNGEGNHFYGKIHSKESKEKISKSRKGKATGDKNSMANLVWRKKASNNLKKKWDSGEMEHARKIMSDTMKETRRSGKLKSVMRSKKEKEIIVEIKKMGYVVEHSLRVETKICDIFIPSLNLIIEYNGDYWHCNPKKYKSDYFNQKKQKTAKELWDYDKHKIDLIREKGYNLEIVWESDLKKDHTLINKLIKHLPLSKRAKKW
jgi:G:T-mismatch repair DNA endonuclease (very short patch repair protein)